MNPYESYYLEQAGSGVVAYTGTRYQKGNGFFGRLISGFALPLLKYFGKQGLETVGNIVTDIKENPETSIKDILKRQSKTSLAKVTDDGANRAKKFIQTGKGAKRYKRKPPVKRRVTSTTTLTTTKGRKCKSQTFL